MSSHYFQSKILFTCCRSFLTKWSNRRTDDRVTHAYRSEWWLHLTCRSPFSSFPRQLIGVIFRKSLRISGRAKLEHTVGQITTMISTDASRLDFFAGSAHKYVSHLTRETSFLSPNTVLCRLLFRLVADHPWPVCTNIIRLPSELVFLLAM